MKRAICFVLSILLLISITGCLSKANVIKLSEGIEQEAPKRVKIDEPFIAAQQDFAMNLYRAEADRHSENFCLSPYSISVALSLAANGAEGETKAEFEDVLTGRIAIQDWNRYMYSYSKKQDSSLKSANSVWFDNGFKIKDDYLHRVVNSYGTDIFLANFHSSETVDSINNWVKESTNGKIENILEELHPNSQMYLANATVFSAKWTTTHKESDVKDEIFSSRSGKKSTVKMMYSKEKTYLKDDDAVGVIKELAGDCSFVALMPDENIDIKDYIKQLTAEKLRNILAKKESVNVNTGVPYFSTETDTQLKDSLTDIGIKSAFLEEKADFTGIADKKLFINNAQHKTRIYVDAYGIKAAASTGVEIITMGITPAPEKEVILNRPFIYFIMDSYNVPLFMGVVTEL